MDAKSNPILVAFRASPEVVACIDAVAKSEGASRAGVARRIVMQELAGMFSQSPVSQQTPQEAA